MILTRDADEDLVILVNNCSLGASVLPNGQVVVKLMDQDTGIPIVCPFDGEQFDMVVAKFNEIKGARIVDARPEDIQKYG